LVAELHGAQHLRQTTSGKAVRQFQTDEGPDIVADVRAFAVELASYDTV
jgi:hypothetical protein